MYKNKIIEDIIEFKKINDGYTNKNYYLKTRANEYFYQFFLDDKYNHKINHSVLKELYFVPRIYYSNNRYLLAKYLKPTPFKINDKFLKKAALILKKLHTSKIKKFPKFNINLRMKQYLKIISKKNNQNIPLEIYNYKKICFKLVKNTKNKNVPCHNDPAYRNFFLNKSKFYLSDWEYATLNNKHFDIAFFITGSYLTKKQEEYFLATYSDYDQKQLEIHKIIVYYLILLWVFKCPKIPFDYTILLENLNKLILKYL